MVLSKTLRKIGVLLIVASATLLPLPALALLVRPVLLDLTTTGADANGSFEVINDRNRPITVEISVNRLTVPETGDVVVTPDEGNDFQIFPAIASIPPGERQVFRIRWVGDPVIPESRLFMFSTTELPISETPTNTGVQVLYAINSVVAVRSPDARPNISIASVERGTGHDGQPGLNITFVNSGPAHGYATQGQLDLTAEGWSHTLRPSELNNAFGIGLVPPNARRIMFLPVADLPAAGEINARLRPISRR